MIVSKLNTLLKRKGWTLYRLRKESGVSYPTLLALRDSKTTMFRADVLEKLCLALHCKPGDLLAISSKKPKQHPSGTGRSE
jgi:DNA-binding Xre family transcriptional regulator